MYVVNIKYMKRIKVIPIILFFFACLAAYGLFIEPNNIQLTHLYSGDIGLKKILENKTAVFLTDIHMGKTGGLEKKVLKLLKNIEPDFIFLTGDFVKWRGDYKPALSFLSQLKAPDGVYAVMGDYDYSNSRKSCLFCHNKGAGKFTDKHPVKFLRNNTTQIVLPSGKLVIAGFDGDYDEGRSNYNGAEIILSHSPLFFKDLKSDKEVLVLSGDTHGGQVPLPSLVWSVFGYEKNAKFNYGLFKDGKKTMYVSRGIGTSHIRFRLFCKPEVVVLHF